VIDDINKGHDEEEDSGTIQKENPQLKGCSAKIPPLDLLDEHITTLKMVQQVIEKIPREAVKSWLRIDLKQMKERLNAKVQQWIRIFTDTLS
jgi:hypothetical protein